MISRAKTPEEYIQSLPEDRKEVIEKLRTVLKENLPPGIEETMAYGMIGYVIPHSIYPAGYHVHPAEPMPIMSLASQKNHIAVYYMGMYIRPEIREWLTKEYKDKTNRKLDVGKSCLRFRNIKLVPYDLIAQLCQKITIQEYLEQYEQVRGH